MTTSRIAAIALAAAFAGFPAMAQPAEAGPDSEIQPAVTRFRCQDGRDLLARFSTERGRFVAIVDALDGYGPHTLASRPFVGGPVVLTWTDGRRTLTWSPGVQIMWMDDAVHRMCGSGGHRH